MASFDSDRVVRAEFAATVVAHTEFVLSMAVAGTHPEVAETLSVTLDGATVLWDFGSWQWRLDWLLLSSSLLVRSRHR